MSYRSNSSPQPSLPLVVTLNCIEDVSIEQEYLAGVARVEHVPLSLLAEAKIESAAAVLLHSLAFLPRAAQRRLRPWQIVLCLGSSDRSVDSAIAADLGLGRLVHVDVSRAEEVADTVMALFLGLLRRTHLLSRHALSASGWLGSVQPLCRGMRRCRGLVLGIIGRSAAAKSLATRSLAFKISVLYYDVHEEKGKIISRFPPAARRMDTLNDLLAASDLISLHCALTNDTIQIINAECLQHVKPGAFLVNTGSSQLLDDCAVKQLLIDGTLAGCALDGAEGPQWMEAWVREMPNVLILPRSADYSEEVWMEIREKAVSILQTFFLDDVIPTDAISDNDEEESETLYEDEQSDKQDKDGALHGSTTEQLTDDIHVSFESSMKKDITSSMASPSQPQESQNTSSLSEVKGSRSSKKAKKRHARQKSMHKVGDTSTLEKEGTPHREDDTAMSGTDQVLSSSSQFASPDDSRSKRTPIGSMHDLSAKYLKSSTGVGKKSLELLKDGCVISLQARDRAALHVSRQRDQGGAWFLDTMSNVTKRDPAAQFLVIFRSKDTIGLRSFTAGGKLLQVACEAWIKKGDLKEVICHEVKRVKPDLLVVGNRGLGPFQRKSCLKTQEYPPPLCTPRRQANLYTQLLGRIIEDKMIAEQASLTQGACSSSSVNEIGSQVITKVLGERRGHNPDRGRKLKRVGSSSTYEQVRSVVEKEYGEKLQAFMAETNMKMQQAMLQAMNAMRNPNAPIPDFALFNMPQQPPNTDGDDNEDADLSVD